MAAANFHLTLAFLGGVPIERLVAARRAADSVSLRPFELKLDRIGYFRRARTLWVGPSQTPPQLTELFDALWLALVAEGFPREPKPFRPHLTLARKAREVQSIDSRPVTWAVSDWVLAESNTHPDGARYTIVERWPAVP